MWCLVVMTYNREKCVAISVVRLTWDGVALDVACAAVDDEAGFDLDASFILFFVFHLRVLCIKSLSLGMEGLSEVNLVTTAPHSRVDPAEHLTGRVQAIQFKDVCIADKMVTDNIRLLN